MRSLLLFFTLFFFSFGFGQSKSYTTLLTEYKTGPNSGEFEWIKRTLKISADTIWITSFGKEEIDVQRWIINAKEEGLIETYHTQLINGEEDTPLPALFRLIKNDAGKVDVISWSIPELPGLISKEIWFYIDYK
ncbi:hypothetical protein C7S20_19205 [Christiangramia fulva]|uniref:Uncharacterized protein n=1 Tax=Christiangramia fulva TaxID=2126553 RepID=A0A2R3ZAA1_9FLAO|nr:hypothetical protein [Christiangramia fulva]AVR47206.1 hypothetical protein C7S20_19205 [Christiangramia fulva]